MSYVVVFRSRLRADARPEYERRGAEIYELAITMLGFIAITVERASVSSVPPW